ncbi:hypothetical protein [Tengunoibacter tsumagoiensis]|uniref:DUF5648 domain-containing protein n=1 Tax=Tengunoibacter tsumagoiensis TaxID=2014871 RepID=A0A401ZXA4_9CHLR|nr:hypothetical protein [Tengunoibacter tsumagoiensis]GCE11480.1 hypothetical protein KTT_13390 [Tengunoibacter tsumagoiensis]
MLNEDLTTQSFNRRGFLKASVAGMASVAATVATASLVGAAPADLFSSTSGSIAPVKRYYNTSTGKHFFTLNPSRFGNLLDGYSLEDSSAFYVLTSSSVPESAFNTPFTSSSKKKKKKTKYTAEQFYCFTNAPYGDPFNAPDRSKVDYLFTTNDSAEGANYGRFSQNDLGFVFDIEYHPPYTVPLFRFYNGTIGEHFYTASYSEYQNIRAYLPSYTYEGVAAYVYSANF